MASFRSSRVVALQLQRLSSHQRRPQITRQLFRGQVLGATATSTSRFSQRQQYQFRLFSISASVSKENSASSAAQSSDIPPPRSYTFDEVQDLSSSPSPNRILIDVREPSELLSTGRIPSAKSMPIGSSPDAVFLSPEDFEDKFGFPRPGPDDEVIFYCKAGVRSRQAALLAGQARPMFGGKVGNYEGSWVEWEKNGGKVQKE